MSVIAPSGVSAPTNVGLSLSYETIESGLVELNTDFSFDAAVRRPSEYSYVLQGGDNLTDVRTGVYFRGNYICAVDRGTIPEFKLWEEVDGLEPIEMKDINRYDDTRVVWHRVPNDHASYEEAHTKAVRGDDNFALHEDGKVIVYGAFRETKVLGRVIRVGWRHTLEAVARKNIRGAGRCALGEKFGVDMDKYPVGTPKELERLLYEE